MSKSELVEEEQLSEGVGIKAKIASAVLGIAMIFVAFMSLTSSFVSSGTVNVACVEFLKTWSSESFAELLGEIPFLAISYYVGFGFYYLFLLVTVICTISAIMAILVGNEKAVKRISTIIGAILVLLFLQMLISLNYLNVAMYKEPSLTLKTGTIVYFIIGAIIVVAKSVLDMLLSRNLLNDELKQSDSQVYNSFVQAVLALMCVFCPIYMLPGIARVFGFDIIFGNNVHFMDYLPMAGEIKIWLILMTILTAVFFIVNVAFYKFNRKLFVFSNPICGLVSKFTIYFYAFLGVTYMLNYIEADGFSKMLTIALGTYAYIPLILLILYKAGHFFAQLGANKIVVQYKIFGSQDEAAVAEQGAKPAKERVGKKGKGAKDAKGEQAPVRIGGAGDPVPAFSELDLKVPQFEQDYISRMEHKFEDITLPALVEHVIEYAKYSRERLSYGPVEVKTFMAGLAASRLSILQGMSGTGKTSLPKIFMEAIDGYCEIVAIESSWRDKNELLGYYNEFNKKYTPKTFTQYLYKASLNKEIPTFIVLDEMNLSRIEYYFSDFLSLMEARENLRFIKLYDVQLFPSIDERENYLALRDGHTIDIPTNVWFIGTANRDESTFEISDKVYDRAQTMNFDKRAPKVVIEEEKTIPKRYVPYSLLRELFDASKSIGFDAEKYDPIKRVEKILLPYKISFGNRVLKQIETFVNAYVACSDIQSPDDQSKFTHEAVDCILFSKVVRKLELKQINDIDEMIDAFTELKFAKSVEFLNMLKDSF